MSFNEEIRNLYPSKYQKMLNCLGNNISPNLYLMGNVELLRKPAVAIIGSRDVTKKVSVPTFKPSSSVGTAFLPSAGLG
jgi:predicted Rossmann fold nucleotide-binding protein DprA/Smf involved in DNA uptake